MASGNGHLTIRVCVRNGEFFLLQIVSASAFVCISLHAPLLGTWGPSTLFSIVYSERLKEKGLDPHLRFNNVIIT